MNPENLAVYAIASDLVWAGGWPERLPWLDPVSIEMVALAAVREAMRTSDRGKPTMGYIRKRVEWRLKGLASCPRKREVEVRPLTDRDEDDLGTPADTVTSEVEGRDEREVLREWLERHGRDGKVVELRLAGHTTDHIAEDLGLSERQVRRILAETVAVARHRFRG